MAKHNDTGIKGEHLAEQFLLNKGFIILERNWRFGRKEVDLIAQDGEMIVIVEIKTRSGLGYGFPEEAVTGRKQAHLRAAAAAYLEANPEYRVARFDVVSILLKNETVHEMMHLQDAFF